MEQAHGLASKREERTMKPEDVLIKLEQHESECNLRYQRIEERLDDQKVSLRSLDYKIWGLAGLIIFVPFAQKLLG